MGESAVGQLADEATFFKCHYGDILQQLQWWSAKNTIISALWILYHTPLSVRIYMSTFVVYSGEAVDALGKKVIADIKASSGKERKFNVLFAKWKYRQKTKLCRVKYQV